MDFRNAAVLLSDTGHQVKRKKGIMNTTARCIRFVVSRGAVAVIHLSFAGQSVATQAAYRQQMLQDLIWAIILSALALIHFLYQRRLPPKGGNRSETTFRSAISFLFAVSE